MRRYESPALLLTLLISTAQPQIDLSGLLATMPLEVQRIRAEQISAAQAVGVTLFFRDEGMRSNDRHPRCSRLFPRAERL